ncbi:uncharacterized protein LOC115928511 [Strongylocentrotus purpuratus]|uniref:Ig-like domain-containing protein n=1 Tax=Strongylocentrotus purpuratus TaxID=7668 RepID=A0A7M7PKM4_STRPU|nr:uncharacterized protein LOC115928511 [Strongylocentrotus purpuratus]
MAVKIALAVGLFILICVPPGIKSSQVVPDGLVYTEIEKTLVQGVQGVFTCRFYGDPVAVYWRKGLDPGNLRPMVVWYDGEVSGPRYDDGSCDVDENYSLIINNVSTADVGRIHCTVSNNKGPLMHNYTDISVVDTAITTNPQATLQLRQATFGLLQCTVHIKARRVSWKKRTTSLADESLVVMESNKNISERSGAGYYDGTYNITQEYSLVIKELQIHHEGLYVCEVTDDTGMSFRNHTFVNVVGYETLIKHRLDDALMQLHTRIGGPIDKELANDITDENRTSLFDTHQMLTDWQSHRLTFTRVKQTIDKEKEPDDIWPYNDELKTISRHLTQESMKEVCKKLEIDFQCDDANDEGKRLETLRKWRTNTSTQPIWDKWEQLFSALESINLGGLLPILKEPSIYKAELVDLAFHLLMQDICPVAKELGINATKLASYRPAFNPSHLEMGTIKLPSFY